MNLSSRSCQSNPWQSGHVSDVSSPNRIVIKFSVAAVYVGDLSRRSNSSVRFLPAHESCQSCEANFGICTKDYFYRISKIRHDLHDHSENHQVRMTGLFVQSKDTRYFACLLHPCLSIAHKTELPGRDVDCEERGREKGTAKQPKHLKLMARL